MYTYPEALDAMEKIAIDLLKAAGQSNPAVDVIPDSKSGTASVSWNNYGGRTACTIRMPVLPAHAKITQQDFANYAGFILHEVGHPLFTDSGEWAVAVRAGKANLLNALEDVRIEKCLIDAGIAANGKAVLSALCHQLDVKVISDKFDPNEPRNIGFVMGYLGRAANGYDLDANLIVKKLRKNSAVSKLLTWALPALAACGSTAEVLTLCDKIVAALPRKDDSKPNKPEKGKGKPEKGKGEAEKGEAEKGEAEKGDSEGDKPESGEGDSEGDKPESGEGDSEAEKGDSEAPSNPGSVESDSEGDSEGKAGSANGAGSNVAEKLRPEDIKPVDLRPENPDEIKGNSDRRHSNANVAQTIIKAIRDTKKDSRPLPETAPAIEENQIAAIAAKSAKASRQRALLAKALKKNEEDLYEGGLKHGKIDRRAYARLAAGSANVFGRREMIDGYDTDVAILVDGSGSMCTNYHGEPMSGKIGAAATLSLIIAQAAAQVGVACSTYLFGTCNYRSGVNGLIQISEGKAKPNASIYAAMPREAGGGTPLSGAMIEVALKQIKRAPNKRRVMFVISDGMCNSGQFVLKGVADYIEQAMGIELANLSIDDPLRGCFRNETFVPARGDIASVGLETLTRKLEKGI